MRNKHSFTWDESKDLAFVQRRALSAAAAALAVLFPSPAFAHGSEPALAMLFIGGPLAFVEFFLLIVCTVLAATGRRSPSSTKRTIALVLLVIALLIPAVLPLAAAAGHVFWRVASEGIAAALYSSIPPAVVALAVLVVAVIAVLLNKPAAK